jgi:hypothetical protein
VPPPDNTKAECQLGAIAAGGACVTDGTCLSARAGDTANVFTRRRRLIKLILCDEKELALFLYPKKCVNLLTRNKNAALKVLSHRFCYSLIL